MTAICPQENLPGHTKTNCPKNSWLADESTAMANPRDQVLGLLVPIDTYSDYRDLHEDNDDDDHGMTMMMTTVTPMKTMGTCVQLTRY